MILPSDNYILLSLVNTSLRDKYSSLEELCAEEQVNVAELTARLQEIGYIYDEACNAFK